MFFSNDSLIKAYCFPNLSQDLGLQEPNNDAVNNCFNLFNKCLSSSLNSILNPSDGKYLDQPLALSLALALPIEEATNVVRNFVAHNKHAPKKIMARIFQFNFFCFFSSLSKIHLMNNLIALFLVYSDFIRSYVEFAF